MFEIPQQTTQFNIVGKIDLDSLNQKTRPQKKSKEERQKEREEKERQRNEMFKRPSQNQEKGGDGERKKRQRIKKDKIDINNPNVQVMEGGKKQKPQKVKQPRPVRVEVSEEDVQRQVKETLARLTSKNSAQKKGAKWRKEKR